MTTLGTSLHSWLDRADPYNGVDWYEHVVSRDFACGCQPYSTYCPEWAAIKNPATPTGFKARSFWVHWNSVVKDTASGRALVQREAARRSYLLVNQWDSWMVPLAKAVNPAIRVFVYKDASSTRPGASSDAYQGPCGVSYAAAPDAWFAKDSNGRRIEYSGYPGHWLMDVSNTAYRTAWSSNVRAAVQAGGFDGVFIDNLLWTRTAYGASPRNYASDAAMQDAYVGFLSWVRGDMQAAGKLMLGNLSNARLAYGRWPKYLAHLDGAWDEWWLALSDTNLLPEYVDGWTRVVNEIGLCETAGKIALVQPHFSAGTVKAFRYAYASYLMAVGTKAAFAEANSTDGYGLPTPWHVEFDWDLGAPLGPYRALSTGLYRRDFTKATVVVNATKAASAPVPLGAVFTNEAGSLVSSVTLAATSGTILRKAG
jgi:hypothetical protein